MTKTPKKEEAPIHLLRKPRGKAPAPLTGDELKAYSEKPDFELMDDLAASVGGLAYELYHAKPYEPPDAADKSPAKPKRT
jgi:hypothetical protein